MKKLLSSLILMLSLIFFIGGSQVAFANEGVDEEMVYKQYHQDINILERM